MKAHYAIALVLLLPSWHANAQIKAAQPAQPTPSALAGHIVAELRKETCGGEANKFAYAGSVAGPNDSYVVYARVDEGCKVTGLVRFNCLKRVEGGYICLHQEKLEGFAVVK
jgi:hypothetical protein